ARDVDGMAEDVRGRVADQRNGSRLRLALELDAVDRLVGGEVDVGGARVELQLRLRGDPAEVVGLGRARDLRPPELLRLLDRLLRPGPRYDVVGLAAAGPLLPRHP